jgi:hypothetical protein
MGDRRGIAQALSLLAFVATFGGDYSHAAALADESLRLSTDVGDVLGAAEAMTALGILARDEGDQSRAEAVLHECLRLARELGHKLLIGFSLTGLGLIGQGPGITAGRKRCWRKPWRSSENWGSSGASPSPSSS